MWCYSASSCQLDTGTAQRELVYSRRGSVYRVAKRLGCGAAGCAFLCLTKTADDGGGGDRSRNNSAQCHQQAEEKNHVVLRFIRRQYRNKETHHLFSELSTHWLVSGHPLVADLHTILLTDNYIVLVTDHISGGCIAALIPLLLKRPTDAHAMSRRVSEPTPLPQHRRATSACTTSTAAAAAAAAARQRRCSEPHGLAVSPPPGPLGGSVLLVQQARRNNAQAAEAVPSAERSCKPQGASPEALYSAMHWHARGPVRFGASRSTAHPGPAQLWRPFQDDGLRDDDEYEVIVQVKGGVRGSDRTSSHTLAVRDQDVSSTAQSTAHASIYSNDAVHALSAFSSNPRPLRNPARLRASGTNVPLVSPSQQCSATPPRTPTMSVRVRKRGQPSDVSSELLVQSPGGAPATPSSAYTPLGLSPRSPGQPGHGFTSVTSSSHDSVKSRAESHRSGGSGGSAVSGESLSDSKVCGTVPAAPKLYGGSPQPPLMAKHVGETLGAEVSRGRHAMHIMQYSHERSTSATSIAYRVPPPTPIGGPASASVTPGCLVHDLRGVTLSLARSAVPVVYDTCLEDTVLMPPAAAPGVDAEARKIVSTGARVLHGGGSGVGHGVYHVTVAQRLFLQLVQLMEFCHKQDMFLGALHPEHVHIEWSREGGVEMPNLRLTRFGFLHELLTQQEVPSAKVQPLEHFMAPELLHGASRTADTDMWAAGALLFYLLTGREPFPCTPGQPRAAWLDLVMRAPGSLEWPSSEVMGAADKMDRPRTLVEALLQPQRSRRATLDTVLRQQWVTSPSASFQRAPDVEEMSEKEREACLQDIFDLVRVAVAPSRSPMQPQQTRADTVL